jgi:GT2 family glycosyltransferase
MLYWLAQKYNSITSRRADNYLDKPAYIYMAIGACYLLTKNYFDHFEMLDDQLFLMGEEIILSHNISSVGGRIIYLPSLIVYHDESSSIKKLTTKELYETSKKSYKIYSKYH